MQALADAPEVSCEQPASTVDRTAPPDLLAGHYERAPVSTRVERVTTRTSNTYAKQPGELERILLDIQTFEPGLRNIADQEVDTASSLVDVVSRVVRIAGVAP
jgi:hypothetical protein